MAKKATTEEKRLSIRNRAKAKNEELHDMLGEVSKQSSQYNSEYVEKLKKEGRMPKLLEIIADCSLKGYSKSTTVDEINKMFFDYFRPGGLKLNTFIKWIQRYPEIANAWSARAGMGNANAVLLKDIIMRDALEGKVEIEVMIKLLQYLDQGAVNKKADPEYVAPVRGDNTDDSLNASKQTAITLSKLFSEASRFIDTSILEEDDEDED